jgi:hypothetical protein
LELSRSTMVAPNSIKRPWRTGEGAASSRSGRPKRNQEGQPFKRARV